MNLPRKQGIVLAVIACLCGMPLMAQDAPPAKEPLILRAFSVPKGTFTVANPTSKTGGRKLAPEVKPISDSDPRPDVKRYFTQMGVPFPPGSEAIFEEEASCIVVRQTPKNLEAIEAICTPLIDTIPTIIQCEISAYRLPSSLAASFQGNGNLTPEAIHKLEKSGGLVSRLLCIAQSGQEAETSLHQRENVSQFYFAPIVGADGYTSDIQLRYTLKLTLSEKEPPLEMKLQTNARVEDGHSVVVQCAEDSQKRTVVIVLHASLLNSCGWPISIAYNEASEPQKNGAH